MLSWQLLEPKIMERIYILFTFQHYFFDYFILLLYILVGCFMAYVIFLGAFHYIFHKILVVKYEGQLADEILCTIYLHLYITISI